jgi:Rrf2 family protein
MRITKWGEFGILSCVQIARRMYPETGAKISSDQNSVEPVPVGAAEIAAVLDIPLDYTQQILHRLRKAGVIKSVRGPRGGFLLSMPARELTLRTVLSASEGTTFDLICEEGPVHPSCAEPGRFCGLRGIWVELKTAIDNVLEHRTIQDIMVAEDQSGVTPVFDELVNVANRRDSADRPTLKVTIPPSFLAAAASGKKV